MNWSILYEKIPMRLPTSFAAGLDPGREGRVAPSRSKNNGSGQMIRREHSIRKAAVLVASLDVSTADLLLAQMPQEQADAVRHEVLQLGELDPAEQQVVIDEFFRIVPVITEQYHTGGKP